MARVLAFPFYTHGQSKVWMLHPPLGVGDLILGDRPNVVLAPVHDGIGPQPRSADALCCRSRSVGCHCYCIFSHCALWSVDGAGAADRIRVVEGVDGRRRRRRRPARPAAHSQRQDRR